MPPIVVKNDSYGGKTTVDTAVDQHIRPCGRSDASSSGGTEDENDVAVGAISLQEAWDVQKTRTDASSCGLPAAVTPSPPKPCRRKRGVDDMGEAPADKAFVGSKVRKYFDGHGWFVGRVTEYFPDDGLYHILYEDGDEEDLDWDELKAVVCADATDDAKGVEMSTNHDPQNVHRSSTETVSLWNLLPNGRSSFQTSSTVTKRMAQFYLFCWERHNMWMRQNRNEPMPWTDNPVLQRYHFCNVFRELDRGTAYFHSHILDLPRSFTRRKWLRSVLWHSYLYRLVNRIESFVETGFPTRNMYGVLDFLNRCASIVQRGEHPLFSAAHQTTNLPTLRKWLHQALQVWDTSVQSLLGASSPQERLAALGTLPGVGSFTSWQILCDLEESSCFRHCTTNTYVALGPGAIAGLDLIFPYAAVDKKDVEGERLDYMRHLVKVQGKAYRRMGLTGPSWNGRAMLLKEVEHALCEYSKYVRLENQFRQNSLPAREEHFRQRRSHKKRVGRTGRIWKSQRYLDELKPCRQCHQHSDRGTFCDSCGNLWCSDCLARTSSSPVDSFSWICEQCVELKSQPWGSTARKEPSSHHAKLCM